MSNPGLCPKCGKVMYASRGEAVKAKSRLRNRRGGVSGEMDVYFSDYCGAWHLTKRRRPVDRRGPKARRR